MSFVIRKMQIKSTVRYQFIPTRMARIKKKRKKEKAKQVLGRMWNNWTPYNAGASTVVKSFTVTHRITIGPSNSTPRYILKSTGNRCSNTNLYRNVHSSTTDNSQQVETTQISISR